MDAARLARQLATAALEHEGALAFRRAALDLLAEAVPADAAVFHALSPRVPLDTGAWRGFTPTDLGRLPPWDRLAVDLAPLRAFALAHGGVVADTEVVPRRGPLRRRYREVVERGLGLRHLALVHLVVRGRVEAVVVLGRRAAPFSPGALALLREVVPALAAADALQQRLDDAPRAALSAAVRCVDERLTPRQREVVELVAQGLTNPQIAAALGVSPNTVRNRLVQVFRRLEVGARAEAVRVAVLR